ncbi:MAG: hypothetical protein IPP83_10725 [Flavobacteriales bacterium]|nr:hypothetical protein [Flavobacteriales bacterium]
MRTLASILLLAFALGAHAQSLPETSTQRTWLMTDNGLVGGLVLDTTQRHRLQDAELRYQQDYDKLLAVDGWSDTETRERLDALEERRVAEYKAIMTAEQFAEWSRLTQQPKKAD